MHRWGLLFVVGVIMGNNSYAQRDTVEFVDSASIDRQAESMLEQSREEDDSSLPDFLEPQEHHARSYLQIRSRYTESMEKSAGYSTGKYLGEPFKSYQRLKFSTMNHVTGGLVLEKDAGERRITDFVAGNISLQNYSVVSKLTIGDYFIEAGQGLALWRSYDVSKGSNILIPVQRRASGLNPYVSSGEGQFLRGAAAEITLGPIATVLFYSQRSRSGTVDSNGVLHSFYDLGYFRTDEEMQKRNVVDERQAGARIKFDKLGVYSLGATVYTVSYTKDIFFDAHNGSVDKRLSVASIDYAYRFKSMALSGEVASSRNLIAGIANFVLSPAEKFDLIISTRYYPQYFTVPNGLGFGESGSNEQGFYVGINLMPFLWCRLSSYFDQYKSSEPTTMASPFAGNDYLLNAECSLIRGTLLAVRYHRKTGTNMRAAFDPYGFEKEFAGTQRKENIRLSLDHKFSNRISLRSRIEHVTLQGGSSGASEEGFLTYQDIVFRPMPGLSINFRVAYCNTDSYASGISEYERDLEGVLTQPILYGSMIRWYTLLRYAVNKNLECSLKYIDAVRDNVKTMGTGLDQLPGNRDARISVQFDIKL